MKISFIIPVFNEQYSLKELFKRIQGVCHENNISPFEVIFIDDGSTDNSWEIIEDLVHNNSQIVKGVRFRKNFGKSTALNTGFKLAEGEIVITMDADLQDDPQEIPNFLANLDEGYDLVSGWKKIRHDPFHKVIPSRFFNFVTSQLSGVKLHDFNCGFKAYRSEILPKIELYGELHRYIPVMVGGLGFRITEIPVTHHPRNYGKSKFGVERYFRGFIDLLTVLMITNYHQKPSHLFSGIGIFFGLIGSITLLYLIVLWFMGLGPIGNRPLLLFGILAVILSFQMISLGLLSEIILQNTRNEAIEIYIQDTSGFD